MDGKVMIVNLFSSSENIKKNVSWNLATELLHNGCSVECLPDIYSVTEKPIPLETLELLLGKQNAVVKELSVTVDILILRSPLATWKLHISQPSVYFSNLVDDTVLEYTNFNVYLRQEPEGLEDLRIKSLLLWDEVYGEYSPRGISVMAANIIRSYKRLDWPGVGNTAYHSYMSYTALQKLINRYSVEAPSFHGALTLLLERSMATASKISEDAYDIQYKNIQVKYKKCGALDIGVLANNYSAYEDKTTRRHRYNYEQQEQYWKKYRYETGL